MSTLRELFMEREKQTLSRYACLTADSKGREYPCTPCDIRTPFQRDRDRIIHSASFRRLMYKTQVFLAPTGDHYRTRMTHTLEVAQIARIIARALYLNEDLTEAIALGHDLGHTPFGHSGEDAMREYYSEDFTHYKQSLRVVERLENNGKGLNLTWEVRNGIVNHTGKHMAATLEGVIVKFADRIAYINHDIDDAIRGGILTGEDVPADLREILGQTHSARINTMVGAIVTESTDQNEIKMKPEIQDATDRLRQFMFDAVYTNPIAKAQDGRAKELIGQLFRYFSEHPEKMPAFYLGNVETDGVERCVCDFISGMTDRYAIDTYKALFIPREWTH